LGSACGQHEKLLVADGTSWEFRAPEWENMKEACTFSPKGDMFALGCMEVMLGVDRGRGFRSAIRSNSYEKVFLTKGGSAKMCSLAKDLLEPNPAKRIAAASVVKRLMPSPQELYQQGKLTFPEFMSMLQAQARTR